MAEELRYDVLVVGGGNAALCAASGIGVTRRDRV